LGSNQELDASAQIDSVFDGVYSFGRDIETREAAWRAALALAGSDSLLCGRSACECWGMIRPRTRIPALIEVAVQAGNATERRGLSPALCGTRVNIVERRLEEDERRRKDGLELTSPPRALIDLAAVADRREVTFAFLEACRLGLFDRSDVAYCFRRMAGRRGVRKLRPLVASWVPELSRIRSVLEGLCLLACIDRGIEMPLVNARVAGYEVDLCWPKKRLVVELDGAAFHGDTMSRQRDLAKTRDLKARGFRVLRISYREMNDDPEGAAARIEAALAR